ncbi:hypothetical protein [Thalassospira lucentensis]|uniref:hypothetical protein n=1 Tax=Thalassospira lucentensis TaxID=168935 RepID=UPI003D2C4DDA
MRYVEFFPEGFLIKSEIHQWLASFSVWPIHLVKFPDLIQAATGRFLLAGDVSRFDVRLFDLLIAE